MHVLKENLKKLHPIHRVGFVLSGSFCFLVGFLGLFFLFMPEIDSNAIINIIINFLDFNIVPEFENSPDDFAN